MADIASVTRGMPARQRSSAAASEVRSSWLLSQWQQRGLLRMDCDAADLEALKAGSWFVRRNRHSPNLAAPRRPAPSPAPPAPRPKVVATRSRSTLSAMFHTCLAPQHKVAAAAEQRAADDGALRKGAGMRLSNSTRRLSSVFLNVYDLLPCANRALCHCLGLGVYHSGIELAGIEYTFDNHGQHGPGVIWHEPYHKDARYDMRMPLRVQLLMGEVASHPLSVHRLLRSLGSEWPSSSYDILERNCHHWCAAAVAELRLDSANIPRWLDRTDSVLRLLTGAGSYDTAHEAASECVGGRSDSSSSYDGPPENEPLLPSTRSE